MKPGIHIKYLGQAVVLIGFDLIFSTFLHCNKAKLSININLIVLNIHVSSHASAGLSQGIEWRLKK